MNLFPASQVPTIRASCERDLLLFAREILDFRDLSDEVHGPLARFLERPGRRKLILAPRLTYKTSLCTVAYSTWRVLPRVVTLPPREPLDPPLGPSLRILVDSDLRANAKKMINLVRWQFEANPRLRQLWGDLKREPGWTDEFFTLQRPKEFVEPTFMSSGIDQVTVGLHFDIGILDDIVNDTNVNTKEQLEKTSHHRRLLSPILGNGEYVVIGCRWSDDDEYGRILREASGGNLNDVIRELRVKGELDLGEWQVFFRTWQHPDQRPLIAMFTPAFIAQQKRDLGGYFFSANYENDPVPQEFATFKRAWVERYWSPPLPPGLRVTMTIDPPNAITAVGYDPTTRERYTLWAWGGEVGDLELIRKLFDMYEHLTGDGLQVYAVGLEEVALQRTYRTLINVEEEKRGYTLPLRSLVPDSRRGGKEARIESLVPLMEEALWYFQRDQVDLADELLRYPKARSRHLVDSLAYHPKLQQQLSRLVYPMFEVDRHVTTSWPAKFDRVAIGIFRPAASEPFGVVVLGRHRRVWYALEEALIPPARATSDIVAALYGPREQWKAKNNIILAPHELSLREEFLRQKFPVRLGRAYQDLSAPASRLASLLERDRFFVGAHLELLTREFTMYSWPDKPHGLVRQPDMRHGKLIGACQVVLWTEDPPERMPWPKQVDPIEREMAAAAVAAKPKREAYSTGYGWVDHGS